MKKNKKQKKFFTCIIPMIILIFNVIILIFPNEIIKSAKSGLMLWFNTVLPSLFPFMVGANILMGFGFVSFMGTLLEPLMLKIFNVSGTGAFALVMGLTSGYPMGAKITADLYNNNKLKKTEAQRLLSFTNNSGPLFIIGAVGIGMFKNVNIGYTMLIIHYISAIITGIIFKSYKYNEKYHYTPTKNVFKTALKNMQESREKENKTFGLILNESIKNSLESVAIVGGFIILFSVLVKMLSIINNNLNNGVIIGILEITNGCNIISNTKITVEKVILASALISWGGLSIHAQAINFISKTDLSIGLYIFSKFIHSIISIIVGLLFIPVIKANLQTSSAVFNIQTPIYNFMLSLTVFVISIFFIVSIGILYNKKYN